MPLRQDVMMCEKSWHTPVLERNASIIGVSTVVCALDILQIAVERLTDGRDRLENAHAGRHDASGIIRRFVIERRQA